MKLTTTIAAVLGATIALGTSARAQDPFLASVQKVADRTLDDAEGIWLARCREKRAAGTTLRRHLEDARAVLRALPHDARRARLTERLNVAAMAGALTNVGADPASPVAALLEQDAARLVDLGYLPAPARVRVRDAFLATRAARFGAAPERFEVARREVEALRVVPGGAAFLTVLERALAERAAELRSAAAPSRGLVGAIAAPAGYPGAAAAQAAPVRGAEPWITADAQLVRAGHPVTLTFSAGVPAHGPWLQGELRAWRCDANGQRLASLLGPPDAPLDGPRSTFQPVSTADGAREHVVRFSRGLPPGEHVFTLALTLPAAREVIFVRTTVIAR